MSDSALKVLVDTNVWIDVFLANRPGCQHARAFISAANKYNVQLLYPVHVIKDVFYLIQLGLKRTERENRGAVSKQAAHAINETAWACVENMRENAVAVGADQSDVWLAFKYRKLTNDLEDNLVLAAAERAQANMLVTSDERLIAKATVPAHTPADATLLLEA